MNKLTLPMYDHSEGGKLSKAVSHAIKNGAKASNHATDIDLIHLDHVTDEDAKHIAAASDEVVVEHIPHKKPKSEAPEAPAAE